MRIKKLVKSLKSPRVILSMLTFLALLVIVILSREELRKAWELLGQASVALLLLLIPFQIIVYFAGGEMIFSYLRDKKLVKHISRFEQTRIALELNLVNHIFPSGGVSGISYTSWRLHKLGVSSARATFAQVVRYVSGFVSLAVLLIIAVMILALDGMVNRYVVAGSFVLVLAVVIFTFLVILMFSSGQRMESSAHWITNFVNNLVRRVSFGKIPQLLDRRVIYNFFYEMYKDSSELIKDKRLLIKPLIWGAVFAIFDVLMFMTAFWSLGQSVNPAVLLIGYGVAGMASLVAITPGGAGVYEAIMILFLSMSGVAADAAIAGIVLTRAILVAGTIVFGYAFYQHALIKYGKKDDAKISG